MSNSSVPSHLYEELGKDEIRLLNVTRDENTKQISCIMTTYHLDNLVPYKALSYAWGLEDDQQAIEVNGHQVIVRRNLYDFLQIYDGGYIWIDQICIDQGRLQEKNYQVAMMSHIYTIAEATLIWLGPDPHCGLVSRTIKQILKEFDQFGDGSGRQRENTSGMDNIDFLWNSHDAFLFGKFFREHMVRTLDIAQMQALAALYDVPYWRRHWIAQEIKFAQKRVVLYGEEELSWGELSRLSLGFWDNITLGTEFWDNIKRTWGFSVEHFRRLWYVVDLLRNRYADCIEDWLSIVSFSLRSHCTNQVDKIYGIQSLVAFGLRANVDYEKSARTLYLETVEKWFQVQSLDKGRAGASKFASTSVLLAYAMELLDDEDMIWPKIDRFLEAFTTFLEVRSGRDDQLEPVHEYNREALRELLVKHVLFEKF